MLLIIKSTWSAVSFSTCVYVVNFIFLTSHSANISQISFMFEWYACTTWWLQYSDVQLSVVPFRPFLRKLHEESYSNRNLIKDYSNSKLSYLTLCLHDSTTILRYFQTYAKCNKALQGKESQLSIVGIGNRTHALQLLELD